ncbi:MAG: hypothetical protein WKG32_22740 [Gemmatimonadaceae bacterium]
MASRTIGRTPLGPFTLLGQAAVDAGEVAFGTRSALAEWAGTHRSQVTRLARGQEVGGEEGWRLTALASVVFALLTVYEPDAIPGWLRGSNPHLGDRRPIDVLAEGDVAAVMGAVQAARVGVFA